MSKIVPMKETPADKAVRRAAMENSGARLLEIVEGIEEVEERQAALSDDKKARFASAKSDGYDTKAIKKGIKRRAEPEGAAAERQEFDAIVDAYLAALEVQL